MTADVRDKIANWPIGLVVQFVELNHILSGMKHPHAIFSDYKILYNMRVTKIEQQS